MGKNALIFNNMKQIYPTIPICMAMILLFLFISCLIIPSRSEASIPYRVTVEDPTNALGAERDTILANLHAAVEDWSHYLSGKGILWIALEVTKDTHNGRFTGGSTGSKFLKKQNGFNIFEQSGTYKLRTGNSVNEAKPDILIQIEPDYMRSVYWIDPHPNLRTDPVPPKKVDLVTVFAHELGHGFGMVGWLNLGSGAPPANKGISPYDNLITISPTEGPTFFGAKAKEVYSGNVPITFFQSFKQVTVEHDGRKYAATLNPQQNIYHLGRCGSSGYESDLSFFSLMAGCWMSKTASSTEGWRIFVNPLDAAVLEDLGVPAAKN